MPKVKKAAPPAHEPQRLYLRQSIAASRYYSTQDLPPAFLSITDEAIVQSHGAVKWGWRQWIMLAPHIHKHLQKNGSKGIGPLFEKWQRQLKIPRHHTRSATSLRVAMAPSATLDIAKLVAFIVASPPKVPLGPYPGVKGEAPPPLALVPPPEATNVLPLPSATSEANATTATPPTPSPTSPSAPPPLSVDAHMAAFMATPIAVFAQPLRALLADVLREALAPTRDYIREAVKDAAREAVIEVVGAPPAPPPPAPPPPPPADDVEAMKDAALKAIAEMPKPSELLALLQRAVDPEERSAPVVTTKAPDLADTVAVDLEPPRPHPKTVPGETFQDKLANAAKDLGLEDSKKECVVIVGLNEHVKAEVQKYYGKAHRFEFINREDFTHGRHLPASTDAVFLCRKKMPHEILAIARRRELPVLSVANTSQAVLWALRETFPDKAKNYGATHH